MSVYLPVLVKRTMAVTGAPARTEIGPLPWTRWQWGHVLNDSGSWTLTADISSLSAPVKTEFGNMLRAITDSSAHYSYDLRGYEDGTLIWQGPLTAFSVAGDSLTIHGRSAEEYLRYWNLDGVFSPPFPFTATDYATILKSIIDDYQAGTPSVPSFSEYRHYGLNTATMTTIGTTIVWGGREGSLFDVVTEFTQDHGALDFWIEPDLDVRTAAVRGSDKTGAVILDNRNLQDPSISQSFAFGDFASSTATLLVGGDPNIAPGIVGFDSDTRPKFGSAWAPINFVEYVEDTNELIAANVNYRNIFKQPLTSLAGRVLLTGEFKASAFEPGDTITINLTTKLGTVALTPKVLRRDIVLKAGISPMLEIESI